MTDHPGSWPSGTPCWIDLIVDDPEATRRFYADALGWRFTEPRTDLADYATALVGGRRVAGVSRATHRMRDVPHAWMVYLSTDVADPSSELCPLLERYPELAASRVQMQPPQGSTKPVRFKQCRSY